MSALRSTLLLFTAAVLLPACGDDDPAGPMEDIAGFYAATEFRIVDGEDETDLLAEDGSIDILLDDDGDWSGTVVAPGAGESGEDIEMDLEGTWTVDGSTVELDHAEDFFLRDIVFEYDEEEGTLSGSCCMTPQIFVTLDRVGAD